MELNSEERGDTLILQFIGELDAFEVQQLRSDLEDQIDEAPQQVILDLDELSLVDSSGIGLIVYLYKRAMSRQKRMVMAGLQGQPGDMLRFLKIDKSIAAYPSVADAETALSQGRKL